MAQSEESKALFLSMIPAFCQSLEDGFNQMVMLPVTIGEVRAKKGGSPTGSISGTIGLSGTHEPTGIELRSQISLIFPEPLAQRIFRSMMMMEEDMPVEPAELQDVVGELANITAGGAKTRLSEVGFLLSLSLPTVAVGTNHYLSAPSGVTISDVIPIELEGQEFYLEVSIS